MPKKNEKWYSFADSPVLNRMNIFLDDFMDDYGDEHTDLEKSNKLRAALAVNIAKAIDDTMNAKGEPSGRQLILATVRRNGSIKLEDLLKLFDRKLVCTLLNDEILDLNYDDLYVTANE